MRLTIIIGVLFTVLDQLLKWIFSNYIELGESIQIIPSFLYITNVRNTGAAWSILEGNRLFLIIISLIALFIVYKFFLKGEFKKLKSIGYGILLGGIIGNLIDRIIYGYVIDFISVYIGTYAFPVFNIADIGIVIGACIIVYILYKGDKDENRSTK